MTPQQRQEANRHAAQFSTGPRTAQGKANSARNSTRLGLFTTAAFVRPSERHAFNDLKKRLIAQLSPESVMEETHVNQIINATWRLMRCDNLEADFMALEHDGDIALDPMQNPDHAATQAAIDRARAHAGNTLRRSTVEIRRLQTERLLQAELGPVAGLASHKDAAPTLISEARRALVLREINGLDTVESLLRSAETGMLQELREEESRSASPRSAQPQSAPSKTAPAPQPENEAPAQNISELLQNEASQTFENKERPHMVPRTSHWGAASDPAIACGSAIGNPPPDNSKKPNSGEDNVTEADVRKRNVEPTNSEIEVSTNQAFTVLFPSPDHSALRAERMGLTQFHG